MMMLHALTLGGILLLLHALVQRVGFAPLLMMVGGITLLLQTQPGMYIQPFPGVIFYYSSTVLVPAVLMITLVVYVANGAVPARMLIFCIIGISIFLVLFVQFYRDLILMPGTQTGSVLTIGQMVNYLYLNPRIVIASLVAFAADLLVIVLVYQTLKNHANWLPESIIIGLAILVGLWTDALVFNVVASLGGRGYWDEIGGDLLAKTLSGAVLWLPTALYLTRLAPHQANFMGGANRPLLDLFFGSPQEIKMMLVQKDRTIHALEERQQRELTYIQEISEHVTDGLWLSDAAQTQVLYVNPAYADIWGRPRDAFYMGKDTFIASIHPEDRARVLAGLPLQQKQEYQIEYRILRPDQTVRWIRDRAYPIHDESGRLTAIVGISNDITDMRQAEKQRFDLALERERVRLLRDFVAEATHDLKTPLSSINLKLHQLTRVTDPQKQASIMDELQQQLARMGKMITDMLTLSRLESLSEFTLTRTDLNQLLRDVGQRNATIARQKDVSIVQMLNDTLPPILAERDELERAFTNLVENAIYYTPSGGRVQIETSAIESEVVLRVKDTGIGIPEKDLAHIFDRFFRAENARSFDPGGTGLGLAIVKKVVEQHQGRVEVSSVMGEGTTFTVRLPHLAKSG
jgi:PAS domain S-box-containing protein